MTSPEVRTTRGALRGERIDGSGISVFRGIPFAAPPVGEHRFRPPQPVEAWDGVRDATAFGKASVQGARRAAQPAAGGGANAGAGAMGMFVAQEVEVDEDCLYLNVWTPAADDAKRPVLVWIHGGAFRMGSGSSPSYDATRLATKGDVVVVTINYRLGTLGFLAHPDLGANYGLADQVAALEWVQREIAAFGGDPSQVTIFGESAGGKSVECLLGMPSARGLFRRAIAQSTYDPPMDAAASARTAESLAQRLGVSVAALRDVDLDSLRAAEEELMAEAMQAAAASGTAPGGGMGSGPVVDPATLPKAPIDAIQDGALSGVELLIGTTLDESALFGAFAAAREGELDDATAAKRLAFTIAGTDAASAPDLGDRALEVYRKVRESRGYDASTKAIVGAATTDKMFRQHSIKVAAAQAEHAPTFMYLFTWPSPIPGLGACHAIELPFVFGTFDASLGRLSGDTDEAKALAEHVQDAWLSFARTGAPSASGLPEWPRYGADRRSTMVLGEAPTVEDAPMDDIRQLWATAATS
jgi:para-nitrobenzyl esterase